MLENKPQSPRWEKFAHALLATTCLGVAGSGVASASTILIVEGTAPAPADFPNTAPGYLLPVGTNTVDGQLNANNDQEDFVEFQGLAVGQDFSVNSQYDPTHQEKSMKMFVYDTSGNAMGSATLEGPGGGTVNGTIPGNGRLVIEETFGPRLGPIGSPTYQISLTAEIQQAPEPAPFLGTALGLAGAWAWRRKRAAQA